MNQSDIDVEIYSTHALLARRFGLIETGCSHGACHRLADVLKAWEVTSYQEVARRLASGEKPFESALLAACIPQETSFFRDVLPFAVFTSKVLAELFTRLAKQPRTRPIRIWSVGCASGQEPYSLAMIIHETCAQQAPTWKPEDFTIMASDVNAEALVKAAKGRYTKTEAARGLCSKRLERFFAPTNDGDYQVVDALKQMITFEKFNLASDVFPSARFDVIFCRNLLIYYERQIKVSIIERLTNSLSQQGTIFFGNSEGTQVSHPDLIAVFEQGSSYFCKKSVAA